MKNKTSRVRGREPRKARSAPGMTAKQAAFLEYLKTLGYDDRDVAFKPESMRVMLKDDVHAVCRVYVPTFYVEPELTAYDVDGRLTPDQEDKIGVIMEREGFEFKVVSDADFPFADYVSVDD